MKYPALFQPIRLGNVTVRNRIAMAPMSTHYANADGSVSPRMIRYYEERARGGTGLVIVEFAYIDRKGSQAEWAQLACHSDTHLPGLAELAERIRMHGAAACLQVVHAGSQKLHLQPPLRAPSAIPWASHVPTPQELTLAETDGIIADFAAAASRVQRAGFDMVELHAAHGYLLTQFLSAHLNQRTDKYGGSRDNRQRFVVEVAAAIIQKVGRDYPVGIRLSAEDYSGGFTLDDTLVLCRKLAATGVAYIHVSSGTYAYRERRITPTYLYPLGPFVPLAERIRQEVQVPVIASGSIFDPEHVNAILTSGQADMVSMARQLFADPHWANKVRAGAEGEVVRCIRCNAGCLLRLGEGKSTRCWVNPATGNEEEFALNPATRRRRVLVIGGGPAGMEAAHTAAQRGHEVVLCEADDALGGQLIPAATPWFKKDLVPLTAHLIRQVHRHKVDVRTGVTVTPKLIDSFDPEVVFVATGARPVWPQVRRGPVTPQLATAHDVILGRVKTGKHVIVVGGGLIGAETAWFLAEQDKQVQVTTRKDTVGHDLLPAARIVLLEACQRLGVQCLTNVNLDEITAGGAVFMDRNWRRHALEADTLVLASGMTPQTDLATDPVLSGREVHVLGDARRSRDIGAAIYEGAYLGRLV